MNKILSPCFALTLSIVLAVSLYAADGDLDPSFGTNGKSTTDWGGPDAGFAMITDDLGRILVAGQAEYNGHQNFAVARYKTDGSMDTTLYGSGGVAIDVTTPGHARAVAVQPSDHKIILLGGLQDAHSFTFMRFDQDVTHIEWFGFNFGYAGGGVDSDDSASSIVLDASEKMIMAGTSDAGAGSNHKFAFVRFNPNFSMDSTFNGGGAVPGVKLVDFFGNENILHAMVLDAGGKILAVGDANNGTNNDFALVRLNPDGSLDSTFGTGGQVTTDTSAGINSHANALALQADGKILVAGIDGTGRPIVIRYNSDGTLDSSFGSGGIAIVNVAGGLTGIAVQSNGNIAACGRLSNTDDFGLIHLTADGSPDTSFGTAGILFTDFLGGVDVARAVLVQQDDRIVAAGSAENAPNGVTDFAVARYGCQFCDDFEDSSLDPAKWTVKTGTFNESLGNLIGTPTKKSALITASGFSGCGHCSFETTMATAGGLKNKVGFYAWYQDKDNYVLITMSQDKGAFLLKQKSGGVVVAKAKYSLPINAAQFYKVKVDYDGAYLNLQIDGGHVIKVPTSTRPFGTAAYFVKSTTAGFGYIEVQ